MPSTKPTLYVTVNSILHDWIVNECEQTGQSKSSLVKEALKLYKDRRTQDKLPRPQKGQNESFLWGNQPLSEFTTMGHGCHQFVTTIVCVALVSVIGYYSVLAAAGVGPESNYEELRLYDSVTMHCLPNEYQEGRCR